MSPLKSFLNVGAKFALCAITSLTLIASAATAKEPEYKVQKPFEFESIIAKQNFGCILDWQIVREESVAWLGCLGEARYACVEVRQVIERCIDGEFVPVSSTVVDQQCDYVGNHSSCGKDGIHR